jgi:hypothetical protein
VIPNKRPCKTKKKGLEEHYQLLIELTPRDHKLTCLDREVDALLIIRDGERYILKPLHELEPSLKGDIRFAEKTERAFEDYQKGVFTRKPGQEFIDELASW